MKKLLGIDYGSKRIGVALTDETGGYALPYSVVQNSKNVIEKIVKICQENNVSQIIIGESKNFSQKDNPIMENIRKFSENLRQKSGLKITFQEEFLTSVEAGRSISGSVRPTARLVRQEAKNDMLDASAAAIILQSFLDTKN